MMGPCCLQSGENHLEFALVRRQVIDSSTSALVPADSIYLLLTTELCDISAGYICLFLHGREEVVVGLDWLDLFIDSTAMVGS